MADPAIGSVKYDPADLTDGNNPLARAHAEGKFAASEANARERLTEDQWQSILAEGKNAAVEAREAAVKAKAKAFEDIFNYNQPGKIEAAIQGMQNPGMFLEPPNKK